MKIINIKYNKVFLLLVLTLATGGGGLLSAQESDSVVITVSEKRIDLYQRVKGRVVDAATKQAVNGASIVCDTYSVLTDEDGNYSIPVSSENEILSISAPGYAKRDIAIRSRNNIDVELYNDLFTASYGTIPTEFGVKNMIETTNSTNSVNIFPNITPGSTIEDMIQTRLGNVRSITRSGTPLMGSALFIRGLNSLNSNAQPLFVVDGVIWDNLLEASSAHDGLFNNPLADIDLKDLESITVLKDGAAIYGSKASNGVILINTIRGRSIATKITVNSSIGYSKSPSTIPMLKADDYKILASEMFTGMGYTSLEISQMDMFNNNPTFLHYNKYHNNTNWSNQIFDDAFSHSHGINVTGGDDNALYAFSLGYTNIDNVIKNSGLNRLNARFNSDIRLSKKVDLQTDISFSNVSRDVFDDGLNARTSPYYLSLIKSPIYSPYKYKLGSNVLTNDLESYNDDFTILKEKSSLYGISNPVYLIKGEDPSQQKADQFRLNISAMPEYEFNEKVSLSTMLAFSIDKLKEAYYVPKDGTAPEYMNNYGLSKNLLKDQTATQTQIYSDTRFKYESKVFDNQHLYFLAGVRYIARNYEMDYIDGHNSQNSSKVSTSLDYIKTYGVNNKTRYIGWYGDVDYSFNKKYFLNVSGALDTNSDFGKNAGLNMFNHGWAFYPSLSGAWLVSSESFMKNIEFIDLLKLRTSYALTGNDDIESYAKMAYFKSELYLGKGVGLELANLRNDDIKWETTAKMNVGVDFNLFNERLSISADYYTSKTKDLLALLTLPDVAGLETYWGNSGELKNTGYELSARVNVLNTRDFKWEMNFNLAHYKNKITKLPQGDYTTSVYGAEILTSKGRSAGVFWGYKSLGVISSQSEAESLNNGQGLKIMNKNGSYSYFAAGDMLFQDVDNNGIIDEKDKVVIGDPNPDFTGLFGNRFRLKDFTLDILFSFSSGNDVYNSLRREVESMSNFYNQSTAVLNRWRVDGDKTSMPQLSYGDPMGNARFSNRWIEDGSYLRLKTVSLSYKIPVKIPYIDGLTFWASANNLWISTKYLGSDPETSFSNSVLYQGIDAGLTPQYTSFYFGAKINL